MRDLTAQYHELRLAIGTRELTLDAQLDEETGIRGYVATGQPLFLQPYAHGRAVMPQLLASLRSQVGALGDESLVQEAGRLAVLNALWEREVALPALVARPPIAAARLQAHGKDIVDRFRVISGMLSQSLNARSDDLLERQFAQIRIVGYIALALIVLVGLSAVLFVRYQHRLRERLEGQEREKAIQRESAHRLEALVQAIPQLVWITDANGKATYFNDRWYEYTGLSPQQAFGERPGVVHPDDLPRTIHAWRTAVNNGGTYDVEYRLRAADGRYRWFVARGVPERDNEGAIVRWFGTSTDVDEQRRAMAELTRMADSIPMIAFITDDEGRAIYRNARWGEYVGDDASSDDATRRVLHPEDFNAVRNSWEAAIRSGAALYETRYRLRRHDGEYRWFLGRAVPYTDGAGKIVRWFGTVTDVHDQQLQLEALQRVADAFHRAALPRLPESRYMSFDATYMPAEETARFGGDWYDAFTFDGRRFVFSMGDVTGHGLEAAAMSGRIRQTIFTIASIERDPAVILEQANRVLALQGGEMATALCGSIDATTGELVYASAGHPPALVIGPAGALREVTSGAPPLGLSHVFSVTSRTDRLLPGEILVCYTDGIIENERDVLAGETKLRAVLSSLTPEESLEPAQPIVAHVLGQRRSHDDVAILTIRRKRIDEGRNDTSAA